MKTKLLLTTLLIAVLLCSTTCTPVDCGDPAPNEFYFRLLSKTDSSNLLFCSNKKYDASKVYFYVKNVPYLDTVSSFITDDFGTKSIYCDSLVNVFLYNGLNRVYMKLNATEIDSFDIDYYKSDCSGGVFVKTLKYNGVLMSNDSVSIYNFYK